MLKTKMVCPIRSGYKVTEGGAMKETLNGRVTMCCTTDSTKYRAVPKGEESYIEIEFDADTENPGNTDSMLLYSPEYKGRADLVGKKVRIVVEVEE